MRESFSPLTNVWELGIVLIQREFACVSLGGGGRGKDVYFFFSCISALFLSVFQADHDELQHCLHWSNGTKTKDEVQ